MQMVGDSLPAVGIVAAVLGIINTMSAIEGSSNAEIGMKVGAALTGTFLGILFPSLGGAVAGIRYFGDFDRFAAISRVSAEKLDALHRRASLLVAAPESALDYGSVADLAHAADDVVISEIEGWQAVFAGKHFAVPV
jgi:hypothetical protein